MCREYRRISIFALLFSLAVYVPKTAVAQQSIQEETIPAQEQPVASPAGESAPDSEGKANEMSQEETQNIGYNVGSVFASVVYSPFKITYAGLGLLTGGLSYVLSGGRRDVANTIIYPAIRGSYVITPTQLKGQKPVIFVASPPRPDSQQQETQPSKPKSPPEN